MNSPDPGPFRWFWASRVTRPCPSCGNRTPVGFDRADPGAAQREATECTGCAADKISNAVQFARGELGYPLSEQGPCARCHGPARIYGPRSRPVCDSCAASSRPAPEPLPVPGPRAVTARPTGPVIPAPRISEAEPELTLF